MRLIALSGVLGIILFMALSLLNFSITGNTTSEGFCVNSAVTDITPSSINIGDEFTIGVQIESCGSEVPEFVIFELINPPTDVQIQEALVINVSKLYYANSERFITYHIKTNKNTHPGAHNIQTRLTYGSGNYSMISTGNISFDIIGDKSDLSLASVKTSPVLVKEDDTAELTIRLENFGDGTANSLKIYLNHSFKGIKEAFIGTLESDEDGPAVFTFVAGKAGTYVIPVTISYNDDFGEHILEKEISLAILKKDTNWFAILLTLVLLVLFGYIVYYLIKTNKKKEEIIKQLLGGEKHSSKKHVKRN